MSIHTTKPHKSGANRHNIAMDGVTRERAEKLAEADKRSVSNLLAVLVDREWERQFPAGKPQEVKEAA